jgi:hypothetical protein
MICGAAGDGAATAPDLLQGGAEPIERKRARRTGEGAIRAGALRASV